MNDPNAAGPWTKVGGAQPERLNSPMDLIFSFSAS